MKLFLKQHTGIDSLTASSSYKHDSLEIMSRTVILIRILMGCHERIFEEKEALMTNFFLLLAKHTQYFRQFSELIHLHEKSVSSNVTSTATPSRGQGGTQSQSNSKTRRNNDGVFLVSQRLKKDARVLCRVAKFFEDAITLEFPDFYSSVQTPLHTRRALKLVRTTLKSDEFESPPAKLDGQYLGYQEIKESEMKFFNHAVKDVLQQFMECVYC